MFRKLFLFTLKKQGVEIEFFLSTDAKFFAVAVYHLFYVFA